MAKNSKKIDVNRRKFLLAATSVTGAVGVCALGVPFVASMGPVSYTHLTLPTNREV